MLTTMQSFILTLARLRRNFDVHHLAYLFRVSECRHSLTLHKILFSDYKSYTTVKVLVVIVPGGGFSFVSYAFPGSIFDKSITVKSGLLNPDLQEPEMNSWRTVGSLLRNI